MLFSKVYLATMFLAGAFAVPMPNNENTNSPAYSMGKEKKRSETVPEHVHARVAADAVAAKRNKDSEAYHTLIYDIDNENDVEDAKEKRDGHYVRAVEDVAAGKRSEDSGAYHTLIYDIDNEVDAEE
ncbi:hypothetical protein F4814DRAFT_449854 [Daldinia grandis]|nr:hypothetical protein F4814DRAFT_449854 [Daldinia grandis]